MKARMLASMAWSELDLWTLGKFGLPRLLLASREGAVLAPTWSAPTFYNPSRKPPSPLTH